LNAFVNREKQLSMRAISTPLTIDRKAPSWRLTVFIGALGLVMIFFSPNPGLMSLGVFIFLFFFRRFFDRELPPLLFYSFIVQWLFFQAQLFDGMVRNIDLAVLDFSSPTKEVITMLGLVAVFSFFLGIHVTSRRIPHYSFGHLVNFLRDISLERLFVAYGATYLFLFFFGGVIWAIPALSQPLFVLIEFRWAMFFLLFVACFAQSRLKGLLLLTIFLDAGLSLFSFFAHFRDVITFSFIAYWVFYFRSSQFARIMIVPVVLFVIGLGSVWSSIKEDYREFLNKGTGAQAVLVSRAEAYDKLVGLVTAINADRVLQGFEILVDRISWIGAFDAVYNYVPARREHTGGQLWLEGIKRAARPRLFFPGKTALTDSKELNYYSGLGVDEKDTSISLSVVAASYIDFGPYWMHAPLFLFGALLGWIFKKAVAWGRYPPVGFALTMPIIFIAQICESSINKLLPHLLLYFICLWGIQKFILSPFLDFIINPGRVEIRQAKVRLGSA
jgi:hypothetical protein